MIALFRGIRSDESRVREFLAEFIGTFFLLFIGVSANIQSAMAAPNPAALISAQLAWGFALAFGVYLAASVSGGHLNPAISLSALLLGQINVIQFALYIGAQLIGAFAGTAVAFVGHLDDMGQLTGNWSHLAVEGVGASAGLFATYPAAHMTVLGSVADQLIGTAILAGAIAMITDRRNGISQGFVPFLVGITLTMISMTFGANGGFAVNPARDLGPRFFTLCIGYGWSVFSAHRYYFWIPLVVPFFGAILGTLVYKMFVGMHGLSEQIDVVRGQYPTVYKSHSVMTSVSNAPLVSFHRYSDDSPPIQQKPSQFQFSTQQQQPQPVVGAQPIPVPTPRQPQQPPYGGYFSDPQLQQRN